MTSFQDTGLKASIITALDELGFKEPTKIQMETIPHLLHSHKDLIALAQTGTGKTGAFGLPVVHRVRPESPRIQAMILAPTRELCLQIASDLNNYSKFIQGIKIVSVYGGDSIGKQLRAIENGAQIVVGTPGRLHDMTRRGKLNLTELEILVLDEADEMLNMGFKEDLDAILKNTPETKQTLLFSATMPRMIENIAKMYMKSPERIEAGSVKNSSDNVAHHYYMVPSHDRYEALRRIADANPDIYAIIFCRTRIETQQVADWLIKDHYSAEAIHGDISQDQREQIMKRFRNKQTRMLVATDVAARGIDVQELTHVINYQLPDNTETYVHRSGRTGRANHTGLSIVIIHAKEQFKIRDMERRIGKRFEHCLVPTGPEICEKQLFTLMDRMIDMQVNEEQIAPFIPAIEAKLKDLTREELMKRMVATEFSRFLDLYANAKDLNVRSADRGFERRDSFGGGRERGGREAGRDGGRGFSRDRNEGRGGRDRDARFEQKSQRMASMSMAEYVLNLGRRDGFTKKHLFQLLNKSRALKGVEVGTIDVQDSLTFFQIDAQRAKSLQNEFKGLQMEGRMVEFREKY